MLVAGELVDAQRSEHLVRFLLAEHADDQRARALAELLVERATQRLRAGDVVRAVEQDERPAADDLEPARRLHARERLGDDLERQRAAHEALGRRERDGGIVGLVRAVQRQEHVGVLRAGAAEIDEPPADREHVARDTEVDVAA